MDLAGKVLVDKLASHFVRACSLAGALFAGPLLTPACAPDESAEAGSSCANGNDCASGFCDTSSKCGDPRAEFHGDGTKSGGETGEGCRENADCMGACNAGTCGPMGATDGKRNNGETDVDCGGPHAPPCPSDKTCETNTDCVDNYCPDDRKVCVPPRSDDGIKNGTETDIDCGGVSGKKCADSRACLADADCIGACNYAKKCVDAPSCKPRLGGDTCGSGDVGQVGAAHESCCRTLPVAGFTDAARPGKTVYLDKYEITAGRVRAFLESIANTYGGVPNVKAWIASAPPPLWRSTWDLFLPSGTDGEAIYAPHAGGFRNAGTNWQFNQELYVYVHGHNCGNAAKSYGYPTFYYPASVQAGNGGLPRADGFNADGVVIPAQELLDVKSMTCIPHALLAAFCHWDGGQLATDEVLDFVTDAPASLGSSAGCGTRCAPVNLVNATGDSGSTAGAKYNFPFFANNVTSEGVSRIAPPGRVEADVVRIKAGDEPWMDLSGNLQEVVLDVSGATFTGNFGLKYRGIGYGSARAGGNSPSGNLTYPEYKAGYSGGRCMRFK